MNTVDRITVPAALVWHRETPLITFSTIARADLDAPFLDTALAAGRVSHFVPLDALDLDDRELRLAGCLHHLTRCGSTLVRRQLDALSGVTALSEPFIVQHLLEGPAADPSLTRRRIRQLVAAWRDALAPDLLVIKWPTLLGQHAAVLADALPEAPTLFLHRRPIEILASIAASPLGGFESLTSRHTGGPVPADPLTAWTVMLARTCRLAGGAANLRAVDYATLPAAGWDAIASYFGLSISDADVAAMRRSSQVHSKHGGPFVPDSARRQASADSHVRTLADMILAPALAEFLAKTAALQQSSGRSHGSTDQRRA